MQFPRPLSYYTFSTPEAAPGAMCHEGVEVSFLDSFIHLQYQRVAQHFHGCRRELRLRDVIIMY